MCVRECVCARVRACDKKRQRVREREEFGWFFY